MSISLIGLLLLFSTGSILCEGETRSQQQMQRAYIVYEKQQREWYAIDQEKVQRIQRAYIDKELRDIPSDKIEEVIKYMAIRPVRMDNGKYSLHAHGRIVGGGILGANVGFFLAKGAVYFIAHGTMGIIAACTGPAALATYAALAGCTAPFVESASNVAGMAGAIAAGVATGPV